MAAGEQDRSPALVRQSGRVAVKECQRQRRAETIRGGSERGAGGEVDRGWKIENCSVLSRGARPARRTLFPKFGAGLLTPTCARPQIIRGQAALGLWVVPLSSHRA